MDQVPDNHLDPNSQSESTKPRTKSKTKPTANFKTKPRAKFKLEAS